MAVAKCGIRENLAKYYCQKSAPARLQGVGGEAGQTPILFTKSRGRVIERAVWVPDPRSVQLIRPGAAAAVITVPSIGSRRSQHHFRSLRASRSSGRKGSSREALVPFPLERCATRGKRPGSGARHSGSVFEDVSGLTSWHAEAHARQICHAM